MFNSEAVSTINRLDATGLRRLVQKHCLCPLLMFKQLLHTIVSVIICS
ncbi:hypothetical protein cypCar_00021956 [Cyprinus carpio]|nr:hypothetical protein cypCar_00021956 [Cyprinus carpio]